MAFYALYKWFRAFYKGSYFDYIGWYKEYLYDEWFNSLPMEKQFMIQKKKLDEHNKRMAELRAAVNFIDRYVPRECINSAKFFQDGGKRK